jgi:hypothetical protein
VEKRIEPDENPPDRDGAALIAHAFLAKPTVE